MSKSSVTYNGRSGDFRVAYLPGSENSQEQFVKVRQGKLEEVTSTGEKVAGSTAWNLAGDGQFTEVPKIRGYGVRRLAYTATRKTNPTTKFHLFVYIGDSNRDTEFTDNEAYSGNMVVPAGSLKFGVKVENWPFQNESNYLSYHLVVEGSGAVNEGEPEVVAGVGQRDRLLVGGFGEVLFPREVEVEDDIGKFVVKPLPTPLVKGGDRNRADLSVVFPYCKTTIRYDPDININTMGISLAQITLEEEGTSTGAGSSPKVYHHKPPDGSSLNSNSVIIEKGDEGSGKKDGGQEGVIIGGIVGGFFLVIVMGTLAKIIYNRRHTNSSTDV